MSESIYMILPLEKKDDETYPELTIGVCEIRVPDGKSEFISDFLSRRLKADFTTGLVEDSKDYITIPRHNIGNFAKPVTEKLTINQKPEGFDI